MALKFGQTKGAAIKGADAYKMKDNENIIRIFGGIIPRYVYWLETTNKKSISLECLSFDRKEERFTNVEKDWVRHYFPDLKCGWAYVAQGYDVTASEKKPVLIYLKKKLFQQILDAAEDLGDPTDPDTGWDINFKKTKTGPHNFNVEYALQVLRCKQRKLTDEEREVIAQAKDIESLVPRATPDQQKKILEDQVLGNGDNSAEEAAEHSGNDEDDDIPF